VTPARNSGESALVVDLRRVPVVSRGEEVDDDVPHDERNPMVTTVASIFSRGGSRGRLEMHGATRCFRFTTPRSICCERKRGNGLRR
jgi:hypothetical protein